MLEDEVLNLDMIAGSTQALELLATIESERREACRMMAGLSLDIGEMEGRLRRFERREERLRDLIMKVMEACDLRRAEIPKATFSIRPSPPKVIIFEPADDLPEAYIRIKKEPDKKSIAAALKSGEEVSGAVLSNQPDTLSIRTK
jgi:Siphovirus Gp157